MYLNIMITLITAVVLFWFVYDEFLRGLIHKPEEAVSAFTGHSVDYFDTFRKVQGEFEKGHFEEVVTLADKMLEERPFESSALSYKGYALFHLKKYAEAKEVFLLLETVPNQDCHRMLDRIDDMLA